MKIGLKKLSKTLIASMVLAGYLPSVSAQHIDEIIVSADFRGTSLLKTAASISVLDSEAIDQRRANHLEQLLNLIPNVNFASGASRGKFIQIRGIGERSQFVEPLNPSVGIIVDGIDFTGLAGAATTLDIQQLEVLRGPQGTTYGANALAGLINLKSNQPTEELKGYIDVTLGSYGSKVVSAALGGPLGDVVKYRVALQKNRSNGFINNDFLMRDDTDNINEFSARTRLDWQLSDILSIGTTLFFVDADNGYDGFSLDNTRHTLSDNPGHDRHKATAAAISSHWRGSDSFDLIASVSSINNDLEYGYDEDWAFPAICAGTDCEGWEYSSEDNYIRQRDHISADIRLVSKQPLMLIGNQTDWTLGLYWRDQNESLLRQYTYAEADFTSDFDTLNKAVYGQLDSRLAEDWSMSVGLRFENRKADYRDSDSVSHVADESLLDSDSVSHVADESLLDSDSVSHVADESLWGGRLSLQYQLSGDNNVYGLISRGYKAGGINSSPELSEQDREFDTELMWNYEVGFKTMWLDKRLQTRLAAFYQLREDIQIKQSLVQSIEDTNASSFTDYFGNAAEGNNYGLEAEFDWLVSEMLSFNGSLGLLRTSYDVPASPTLDRREQAHAPNYQFAFAVNLALTDQLELAVEAEGKDKFFLSSRHDAATRAYELINAYITYTSGDMELSLWGRNLTNEEVVVRGFGSFGNDPRKFYVTEPYYQYGEPRVFGISASVDF